MAQEISDTECFFGHRLFDGRSIALGIFATVLAFAVSACGGSDSSGPDPITVTFSTQPSAVETGQPISPAVEVGTSSDSRQTVTLSIADNDCGASLAGEVSRATVNGAATFSDLAIDIPADDFTLEARVLDQTVRSTPFDVLASDLGGPLAQHPTVCLRGRPQRDAASLTWVPRDDLLWTADDSWNQILGIDRRSGVLVNSVSEEEILTAFPDAADCDDGDGNPATSCSYTSELEVVAYDDRAGFLYVFNTVNNSGIDPNVDRPAVFRLRSGSCRGCLEFDAWNELSDTYSYRAAVAIDGKLFVSNGPDLHRYDFDTNTVTEEPELQPTGATIKGLSFWDGTLSVLTVSNRLAALDWDEREVESNYDLSPVGVIIAAGIEVVRDTIYVLEGEPTNPIFVVTIDPDQP